MTSTTAFTDADLTAFLDGEAPQDLADRIAVAARSDPELAARIEQLDGAMGKVRQAFDALLEMSPPMPALPAVPAPWQRRDIAAGLVIGLLAGLAGAQFLPAGRRDWMDFVAAYQALYVAETLSDIDVTEAEAAAQLVALSGVLQLDLRHVRDGSEMTFKRGQLLGYDGAQLVQLAFQTADGTPVALCILRDARQVTQPFENRLAEGMQAIAWGRDGYGFLLIGATDAGALRTAAAQFDNLIQS